LRGVILRFGGAAYSDDEVESEEADGDGTELVGEWAGVDGTDERGDDMTEVIPASDCSEGVCTARRLRVVGVILTAEVRRDSLTAGAVQIQRLYGQQRSASGTDGVAAGNSALREYMRLYAEKKFYKVFVDVSKKVEHYLVLPG
jgi:hypothetical protein